MSVINNWVVVSSSRKLCKNSRLISTQSQKPLNLILRQKRSHNSWIYHHFWWHLLLNFHIFHPSSAVVAAWKWEWNCSTQNWMRKILVSSFISSSESEPGSWIAQNGWNSIEVNFQFSSVHPPTSPGSRCEGCENKSSEKITNDLDFFSLPSPFCF